MKKLLIAMSGGVDSAVTAALAMEQGYEVAGATMRLHEGASLEIADARASCERLGIDFYEFDWRQQFWELVQKPFMEIYRAGRTPNPCVICNKTVKFGLFLDEAERLGFGGIATGHYARIETENGRTLVKTAQDVSKDQTYMLWSLSQQQLSRVVLPMGTMTKEAAREKAEALGLAVAHKHDSQDICFIPDGDYMAWLTKHGLVPQPGRFIGPDGEDLGPHRGLEAYTVGQRRGLDIAYGSRIYVAGKRGTDVLLGPNEALFANRVLVSGVNFIPFDTLPAPIRAQAKLRYTQTTAACTIVPREGGAELVFDEPQRAVTPGQSAVFYDGETLLGGGIIEGTL